MIRSPLVFVAFSGLVIAWLVSPARAQLAPAKLQDAVLAKAGDSSSIPAADVKQQRKEVADRLRVAQRQLDSEKPNGPQESGDDETLVREIGSLKQLEVILAQQQAAQERKSATEKQIGELESKLKALRSSGPEEPKPYSFLLLDQLRDELVAESARKDSVDVTVEATSEALERAKTALDERERDRRRAKEAVETNNDEKETPRLAAALAEAELNSRLASEILKLRQIDAATEKLSRNLYELQISYLTDKAAWVAKDTRFTAKDLQAQTVELEKQEQDLKRSLETAESSAQYLEQQWFDARTRLDAATSHAPELLEEVEARRLARHVQQQRITVLSQRLARLEDRRQAWVRRFKVAQDEDTDEDREKSSDETRQKLDQLDRERRLLAIRIDEVRKDQATLESKIESDPERPAEVARWLQEQQRHLGQMLRLHERNMASIDTSQRVHEKLLGELRQSEPAATIGDQVSKFWDAIAGIWNYELASIDDRPITVKKIVTGVLLLFVGYLLSRLISAIFGGRFLPRCGVNPRASAALQSVMFYTLVVMFAVFALRVVNVPLTAFTLLGGALALGVGFGSQNIINNFISGLILLAERPIKVGDLIQLDDLYGTVEHIGARSTRVRTGTNHDIIVPNSSFLENNVVNWTLSDDRIRTVVKVGVVYGSPTREVTRLMQKAVENHGLILAKPEPIALFTDFSDNSLNFEIHFWIKMQRIMDRLRIESDLRYRIDQLFREAGLVIAFPQRDVHLDSVKPLEVRVLRDPLEAEPTTQAKQLPKRA